MFTPIWGRWTHFDEHIFQLGRFNHQLVIMLQTKLFFFSALKRLQDVGPFKAQFKTESPDMAVAWIQIWLSEA